MSDTEHLDTESARLIVRRIELELDNFKYATSEAEAGNVTPEEWWKTWLALTRELASIHRSAAEFRALAIQTDVELATARRLSQDVVDDYQAETAEQRKQ